MRIACVIILGLLLIAPARQQASAQDRLSVQNLLSGLALGSSVVKVRELPNIPQLRTDDGQYIDLGYLHRLGGNGEWVGHVDSSRKYLPLTKRELDQVLVVSGLYRLPPVPEKSGGLIGLSAVGGPGFSNNYWWISLFVTAALSFGFKATRRIAKGAAVAGRHISNASCAATADAPTSDWSKAHEQIARASKTRDEPTTPTAKTAIAPTGALATPQGFGRRSR